jgi:hypothetical protein
MPRRRKPGLPPKQYKNITVDSDIQALLSDVADLLEKELGFRPSISQTICLLVKRSSAYYEKLNEGVTR